MIVAVTVEEAEAVAEAEVEEMVAEGKYLHGYFIIIYVLLTERMRRVSPRSLTIQHSQSFLSFSE